MNIINSGKDTTMNDENLNQSHLNGRQLAHVSHYFDDLIEEGKREEEANIGSVWTIQLDGTATVKVMGIASCDYTLHLNCSHVGPSMYGVYRGEIGMDFKADISGTKLLLLALGMRSNEDVEGWFKNKNFVMKIDKFNPQDEIDFIDLINSGNDESKNAPKPTGDETKDAIAKATYDSINSIFNSILGNASASVKLDEDANTTGKKPMGFWYDWDFHMTEGDMGMFLNINGGLPWYAVKGNAKVDKYYETTTGQTTVRTPFTRAFSERYEEDLVHPFPYTVKLFPDGTVLFTLYNAKGGPITVSWAGKISSIPVEKTEKVG